MSNVDGMKVVMSRAPMTTPSVMNVRVITDEHPLADMFEEDAIYHSPLAVVRDAGDCDGDNRTFTRADDSELKVTTVENVINNVIERTGSDQLVPGAAYWGDHYNVPSAKSVAKKRKLGRKNLSVDVGVTDLTKESARQSLAGMLEGSTQMFQEAVGWVHRMFLTTDLYLSLVWTLQDTLKEMFDWEAPAFSNNKSLVLILSEIYEVPLGGLSWEAYDVIFGTLVPVIKEGQTLKSFKPDYVSTTFVEQLNAASMNGEYAAEVFKAAELTASCRAISSKPAVAIDLKDFYSSPDSFLELTAELAALISKGQLEPQSDSAHRLCVELFLSWITTCDPNNLLVEQSLTLSQVWEYATVMFPALTGEVPEIDLSFFD